MRSNVTPRPSERRAGIINQPSIFLRSTPPLPLFVDYILWMLHCTLTRESQECSLSPCWPDCISVLMYFSGFTRSDVYSLQHYLQHCIAHIKLEIVCVCACRSGGGWMSSVWNYRATFEKCYMRRNSTLHPCQHNNFKLILSAAQLSVMAVRNSKKDSREELIDRLSASHL